MSASPSDLLASYLRHIDYSGTTSVNLNTLQGLVAGHAHHIPFENFAALLGEPVSLDLPVLQSKLLSGQRGGWCFEHNTLLWAVLQQLGFEVSAHAARVLWMQSPDARPARSHMLLRVRLPEGDYLADVGFGALTLPVPLALQADVTQHTPHGSYRLTVEHDGWTLWARGDDDWLVLYQFDLQPQQAADFEVTCWYLCHHPQSRFLHNIMAARLRTDGRHTLRDGRYTWRNDEGVVTQRPVADLAELLQLLRTTFGIVVPNTQAAHTRLQELLRPA